MEHPRISPSSPPLVHRITLEDTESQEIDEELNNSLIFEAHDEISVSDVLAGLPFACPEYGLLVVRYVGDNRFLIKGPEKWRKEAIERGTVTFGPNRFSVSYDLSCLSAHTDSVSLWIRISNLDYDMRGFRGLYEVVNPFGTLIGVDYDTHWRSDLRWARVFVKVVDTAMIPNFLWLEVSRKYGMQSNVKVNYTIEAELMSPPIEWYWKHIAQAVCNMNVSMDEGIQNLGKDDTGKTSSSQSSHPIPPSLMTASQPPLLLHIASHPTHHPRPRDRLTITQPQQNSHVLSQPIFYPMYPATSPVATSILHNTLQPHHFIPSTFMAPPVCQLKPQPTACQPVVRPTAPQPSAVQQQEQPMPLPAMTQHHATPHTAAQPPLPPHTAPQPKVQHAMPQPSPQSGSYQGFGGSEGKNKIVSDKVTILEAEITSLKAHLQCLINKESAKMSTQGVGPTTRNETEDSGTGAAIINGGIIQGADSGGGQELVPSTKAPSAEEPLKATPFQLAGPPSSSIKSYCKQMPSAAEKRKMLATGDMAGGKKQKTRHQHIQRTGGGGIPFKKSKEQPILKNPMIVKSFFEKSGIKSTDVVLEIGPGTGNLTKMLLECAKSVVVVELDPSKAMELNRRFQGNPYANRLKVIQGDVLQCDLPYFDICVGNIPYCMSYLLIFKLLSHRALFRCAVIMLQKDFAMRLMAKPGDNLYCRLSVNTQLLGRISHLLKVGQNNFRPSQEVDFSLVRIEQRQPLPSISFKEWGSFTKLCFTRKNRTLGSIFKRKYILDQLEKNYKTLQLLRLSGNPHEVGDRNQIICEEVMVSIVNDEGMMESERESGDEEDEIEADSSSNLLESSSFKDTVIGLLSQGDFQEKRPSKLTQVDLLYLLSLFNNADIYFS